MRQILLFFFILLVRLTLTGQAAEAWTLERAVAHAQENNLQVRQLDNAAALAGAAEGLARAARRPTVSGSTNAGLQFGRTIDPTTNTFDQQTIGFQGYQLQGGITLFQGGSIKQGIRRASLETAAAELDRKVTKNTIGLQVANGYLNVVLFTEQLRNATARLALVEEQLVNTDALIRAGAVPAAQRFDLQAQQAAARSTVIELENQVATATLALKLLLELDYATPFAVAAPTLTLTEEQLTEEYQPEQVFLAARASQPVVAAAEMREQASAVATELAQARYLPTVSVFGSLSTNFSSVARDFSNPIGGAPTNFEFGPPVPVQINGMDATISQLVAVGGGTTTFPTIGYFNQLDRNFGQSLGASVNIPIYSQGRKRLDLQNARLQRENAQLAVQQAENNLWNDVQLALNNVRAARESYRAAAVSLEAAVAAYENTQRSFRAGAASSFDLITATNQLDQARTELTRSKYQFIFNRQVIRFYLGQGLRLE